MIAAKFTILAALGDRIDVPQTISRALFERFWREEHFGSGACMPSADGNSAHFRHQDECYGIDFEVSRGEPRVVATLLWSTTTPHDDIPDQGDVSVRKVHPGEVNRERVAVILDFYEEMRCKLGERAYRWPAKWWTSSITRAEQLASIMRQVDSDQDQLDRYVMQVGSDEVELEIDRAWTSWRARIVTTKQRRIEKLRTAHDLMDQHKLTRREVEQHMPA